MVAGLAAALGLIGCAGPGESTGTTTNSTPIEVVLMTHDSFAVSDELLEAFRRKPASISSCSRRRRRVG